MPGRHSQDASPDASPEIRPRKRLERSLPSTKRLYIKPSMFEKYKALEHVAELDGQEVFYEERLVSELPSGLPAYADL